jgi:hypothetical protein
MQIDTKFHPPPKKIKRSFRLTTEMKNLPINGSFVSDRKTALCFYEFCRHHGYESTMRTLPSGEVRSWRLK